MPARRHLPLRHLGFLRASLLRAAAGVVRATHARRPGIVPDVSTASHSVGIGNLFYALLKEGEGRWSVRDYALGPTDVAYAGWPEGFGAPAALFGLPH